MNATLLVAHGSRDSVALTEIHAFADAYRARHPGTADPSGRVEERPAPNREQVSGGQQSRT